MNSSDTDDVLRVEVAGTPLVRLLTAMAGEWVTIAAQIEELGIAVSGEARAGDAKHLQAFDLIHQRAQGMANLLTRLSRKLADDQFFDRKRLSDLIEDIPFHSVRAGLEAAFDGRSHTILQHDDDVDWL